VQGTLGTAGAPDTVIVVKRSRGQADAALLGDLALHPSWTRATLSVRRPRRGGGERRAHRGTRGPAGRADAYSDAADRWDRFGVVPEQVFALLGQGRCLIGLFRATEASSILGHAREIFERLSAAPALAKTDALLQPSIALNS
jgi:hypothetical protein